MPKRFRDYVNEMKAKRRRRAYRRKRSKYYKRSGRGALTRTIKRVMLNSCETKNYAAQQCQNKTMAHNEFTIVTTNLLYIGQGDSHHQREGDQIYCRGIKLKFYFENQQYRPFARYKIIVVRNKNNPSSQLATGSTDIWEGNSTSKNLDWFDKNKYEFKVIKNVTVTAPNTGTSLALGGTVDGVADKESGGTNYEVVGNPSKYVNIWIPFNSNIQYLDNSTSPSTQQWQLGVIAYSSYGATTAGATYPVGHVTCMSKVFFKDP